MKSSLFGEFEYTAEEVYQFEQGLPGFPEEHEFIFIKVEESPFTVLHSVKQDLYFFLIDPFTLFPDYEFTLPDSVIEKLDIRDRNHVLCYSIVVLREPFEDSTANLVAPVIINTENRKGVQLVLENSGYSVRQPLFSEKHKKGYNNKNEEAADQSEMSAGQQR
jgi:flagellar assembly factor FliW